MSNIWLSKRIIPVLFLSYSPYISISNVFPVYSNQTCVRNIATSQNRIAALVWLHSPELFSSRFVLFFARVLFFGGGEFCLRGWAFKCAICSCPVSPGLLRSVSRAVDLIMAHFGSSRDPYEKVGKLQPIIPSVSRSVLG